MADGYVLTADGVRRLNDVARLVEGGLQNPNVLRAAGPRSLGGGSSGAIVRVVGPTDVNRLQAGYVQSYNADTGVFSDAYACWLRTPNTLAIEHISGESRAAAMRIAGAEHDGLPVYFSVCC